jgi:hypothetical protein
LQKTFPPLGKRNINYWWNEELSLLRAVTLKKRRLAQREVRIGHDYAGQLVAAYKDSRKMLKAEINKSKNKVWKEFCVTPHQDPYQAIRTKMAWKVSPDGLLTKRVSKIVVQLFIAKEDKQGGEDQGQLIPQTDEEGRTELDITETELMIAMKKIDPNKAVGVDGVPGDITRIITEQRPMQLLNLLN